MQRSPDTVLYLAYTAASVAGLILMKSWLAPAASLWKSESFLTWPTLLVAAGACLYIASFLLWLVILTRNDLSFAYPVAIGLTLIFLTVAASIVLGETLSLTRLVGILVIFTGIWLVTRA
jgi:drug/metabolite transporter (DMT)-like permease